MNGRFWNTERMIIYDLIELLNRRSSGLRLLTGASPRQAAGLYLCS
jgi:hypothetical protein